MTRILEAQDRRRSRGRRALVAATLGVLCLPTTLQARVQRAPTLETEGLEDPRQRPPPRRHRLRLGVTALYQRLTQARAPDNTVERFHLVPILVEVAYQLQFLKWAMVRPSFGIGPNVANSSTAMPVLVHPALHVGYQGSVLGIALGYGYYHPVTGASRKDVRSAIRGGLGQPVFVHNHHIGGEISITTRVDRGALNFALGVAGVSSQLYHFNLDDRRWGAVVMFHTGWFFGPKRARPRSQVAPVTTTTAP